MVPLIAYIDIVLGEFHVMDFSILALYFLVASYGTMQSRKLMLLEKGKLATHSKKWKDVLRTLQDGIMICIQSKIVFYNKGLEEILHIGTQQGQLFELVRKSSIMPLRSKASCELTQWERRCFRPR